MEVTARIQAVANRVSETLRSKLQGISLSRHSSNARGGTALGSLPAKIKEEAVWQKISFHRRQRHCLRGWTILLQRKPWWESL